MSLDAAVDGLPSAPRFRPTFAIGLLAGSFGGLVGLGGGVIMIPLLIASCRMTRHQAHATSLAAVIATGAAGAARYAWQGQVDWLASLVLAIGALMAARAGALCAQRWSSEGLRRSFGGFLILVAGLLVAKPWLLAGCADLPPWFAWSGLALAGLVAGFIAGLLGVGGGSIMVPGMVLLAGLPQAMAQGSSLLAMVPAAVVGTWTHARAGTVVGAVLPGLLAGVLIGTPLGAQGALLLPEPWLRGLFCVFLCWLGWRELRPGRGGTR